MDNLVAVNKQSYAGLFVITLATIMYEILLTRIFSVTMWYHFAFMAISVALFGMTVGAIIVYLFPNYFSALLAKQRLALNSLLFSIFAVLSFLAHLNIPFIVHDTPFGWYPVPLTYLIISIPFIFSGICVCLILTKFPQQVSKLYAADLIGSAIGCLLIIYTLKFTDGPTAVFVTALLISIGALLFALDAADKKLIRLTVVLSSLLTVFIIVNTVLTAQQKPVIRIKWAKGKQEVTPLYEKWNSFSRIRIWSNPKEKDNWGIPFGWGISYVYYNRGMNKVRQLHLNIDSEAYTVLTGFNGDLGKLRHLKYDLTNLVYYFREKPKVLIVGVGGGRDILSALAFNAKSVVGVEINDVIINAVNQRFGDFTGHLDKYPQITFVNDEARSFIARQKDEFDIIQVSLIDTWAATAAGAFVLTENSLYTVEAWKIFLEHLTPNGILTFSRWYSSEQPLEPYRLTSLAAASLKKLGITDPRKHIIILRYGSIGTMLVSKSPFTEADMFIAKDVANQLNFAEILTPAYSVNQNYALIASGENPAKIAELSLYNVAAPTDDSPFFFNMLRLQNVLKINTVDQNGYGYVVSNNCKAVRLLGILLITVIVLTLLCIILPLALTTKTFPSRQTLSLFLFFLSIGLGFMLVEISQMQKLVVFLGHPVYSLSVVLFSLLLSSGLGSYSTHDIEIPTQLKVATARLFLLLCLLVIFGALTPYATTMFQAATTPIRILIAITILFPLGFFMGMAFPLGLKLAALNSADLTPWLWGINGAASVCASVFAVAIALSASISTAFWAGFVCYVLAFLAFVWAAKYKISP